MNLIKNIGYLFMSLLYKRDKKIVIIGAWFGDSYSDNSRALYEYLSVNKEKYELEHVVWSTRSKKVYEELKDLGLEVYMMDSKESIYYHKKAKYHIICNSAYNNEDIKSDLLTKYSYGAVKINLWHGAGAIKSVGYKSRQYKDSLLKDKIKSKRIFRILFTEGGWGDCYYLVPSNTTLKQMQEMHHLPKNNYIKANYPRLAPNLFLLEEEKNIISEMEKYNKVLLYLPTFRLKGMDFNYNIVDDEFSRFLKENNYLLIEKYHSYDNSSNESFNENVLKLSNQFDINSILNKIDIVITDYSSVCLDAYFYGKEVSFYTPDIDEYDRRVGIVKEAKELFNNNRSKTISDLIKNIKQNNRIDERIIIKYWGTNEVDMDIITRKLLGRK